MKRKNNIRLLITLGVMLNIVLVIGIGNGFYSNCSGANFAEDLFVDQQTSCSLYSESMVTDRIILSENVILDANVTVIITDNRSLIEDLFTDTYDWSILDGVEIHDGATWYVGDSDSIHINEYNHPSAHPYFDLAYHYSFTHYGHNSKNFAFNLSDIIENEGWVYAYVIIKNRDYPGMLYHSNIGTFLFCKDPQEHVETKNLLTFNSVQASYGNDINVSYIRNTEETIEASTICYKAELYINDQLDSCNIMYDYNISSEADVSFIFDNLNREISASAYIKLYIFSEGQISSLTLAEFNLSIYENRSYFLGIFAVAIAIICLVYVGEKVHSRKTTRILLQTYLGKSKTEKVQSYSAKIASSMQEIRLSDMEAKK
jgi:hypothetical protein